MKTVTRFAILAQCILALVVVSSRAESASKDADNTARNKPDRSHEEVTPRDQGNSPEDIDTTKRIRQAIIANKSLSTNAHNVKIITTKGQVTLRGPVNNEEEMRAVKDIATSIASSANVDCQIEVKKDQLQK